MKRRPPRRGVYVVVEGIDGSGKSRLTRSLAASLRKRGWSVAARREPHDRTLGALGQATSPRDPWTAGVYFTLDRILAHRELERDLRTHDVVVSDRSFYSTLAYQGSALPATMARRLARLQSTATTVPDRVVFLAIEPSLALRRLGGRSSSRAPLERRAILRRVDRAYRRMAHPPRWIVEDASRAPAALLARVLAELTPHLPPRPRRTGARSSRRRT